MHSFGAPNIQITGRGLYQTRSGSGREIREGGGLVTGVEGGVGLQTPSPPTFGLKGLIPCAGVDSLLSARLGGCHQRQGGAGPREPILTHRWNRQLT